MQYQAVARNLAHLDVFHAIADPTRRRIVELLAERPRAVQELVAAFHISQPSISEHLRILRNADLVSASKKGRKRIYSLMPIILTQISSWAEQYTRHPSSAPLQYQISEPVPAIKPISERQIYSQL